MDCTILHCYLLNGMCLPISLLKSAITYCPQILTQVLIFFLGGRQLLLWRRTSIVIADNFALLGGQMALYLSYLADTHAWKKKKMLYINSICIKASIIARTYGLCEKSLFLCSCLLYYIICLLYYVKISNTLSYTSRHARLK